MQLKNPPGILNEVMRLLGQQPSVRESQNIIDARKLEEALAYSRKVADESQYAKPDMSNEQTMTANALGLGPVLLSMDQMMRNRK